MNTLRIAAPLAALVLAVSFAPAAAETFVFPHLLEQSGDILSATNTFDTQIFVSYSAGIAGSPAGGGATVDLYLFDEATGQLLLSNGGTQVCAPCTFQMGDGSPSQGPRKATITVDDLIVGAGGFPASVVLGYAIAVVSGDDANVTLTSGLVNARSGPGDLAVFVFEPQPIAAAASATESFTGGALVVFPHFVQTPGAGLPNTIDTQFFITYVSGQGGLPAGSGADVDLYLFDEATSDLLLSGTGTAVCDPCTFSMGTGPALGPGPSTMGGISPRKRKININDLISAAGGFGAGGPPRGFAVAVVRGSDPAGVALTSAMTIIRSGPADLTVNEFRPEQVAAVAPLAVEPDVPGDVTSLRAQPNPAAGGVVLGFALARRSDVTFEVFDAQGRRIASEALGARDAGDHTWRWNGRDEAGRRVAAGTYFGRVIADDGSRATRLVMLSR